MIERETTICESDIQIKARRCENVVPVHIVRIIPKALHMVGVLASFSRHMVEYCNGPHASWKVPSFQAPPLCLLSQDEVLTTIQFKSDA